MTEIEVDTLIRQCHHADARVREDAARELEQVDSEHLQRVGPLLTMLLSDPDQSVRHVAVEALGALRYQPAWQEISRLLRCDEDWIVRSSAAEALGEIADVRALEALATALTDEAGPVRRYAALAIGLVGDSGQVLVLVGRLSVERDQGTIAEILTALLRLGDRSAFDSLVELADEIDEEHIHGFLNAIEDLLARKTPGVITKRASELERALTGIGKRFSLASQHVSQLRARLIELANRFS